MDFSIKMVLGPFSYRPKIKQNTTLFITKSYVCYMGIFSLISYYLLLQIFFRVKIHLFGLL